MSLTLGFSQTPPASPWRRRPWPVSEIPGPLGDDLRHFYRLNPHLPERAQ